jgi:hypothetical protein
MTGGLGRTPGIRAALPLAPDEVGVSADRYTPVPDLGLPRFDGQG